MARTPAASGRVVFVIVKYSAVHVCIGVLTTARSVSSKKSVVHAVSDASPPAAGSIDRNRN